MPNEVFAKIFEVIVARTWMVSIVQTSARKLRIISPKSSNDNTSWPKIVWLLSFIFGSLTKRGACSFDWFFDFDSVFISIWFRFRRSPKSSVRDAIVDYLFRIAFVCFHLRFVEVRSSSNERLKLRLKIKFRVRSAGHENSNREGWRFRTAVKLNGFRRNTTGSLETMGLINWEIIQRVWWHLRRSGRRDDSSSCWSDESRYWNLMTRIISARDQSLKINFPMFLYSKQVSF